jgi:hypothetical protein
MNNQQMEEFVARPDVKIEVVGLDVVVSDVRGHWEAAGRNVRLATRLALQTAVRSQAARADEFAKEQAVVAKRLPEITKALGRNLGRVDLTYNCSKPDTQFNLGICTGNAAYVVALLRECAVLALETETGPITLTRYGG